jgi:protein TonB
VASRKPAETGSNAAKIGNATKENGQLGAKGSSNGSGETGSGSGDLSQFSWYKDMIHDRFYSRWAQPVGLGQDVVATLKLRINNDGTISNREIMRSSGNPQMDESVLRAAQKLEQIDPLPKGLGNGEFFDVNVNFKVGG